jgi:hypothetical protein|tara:strand:- start:321 stop:836 length:516 start_codon:yes stop_codon:yes gene_type:complete
MTELNSFNLDQPVPGQSLTTEPEARPWENPAEFTEPLDALDYYTGQILMPDRMARLMEVLETGFPVVDLIDAITLAGVMEGKHSVDVAVIISPHLLDIVTAVADSMDVKYTMGTEKDPKESDPSLVAKVSQEDEEDDNALEEYEKEKIEAYLASQPSGGLMSRPSEQMVEE